MRPPVAPLGGDKSSGITGERACKARMVGGRSGGSAACGVTKQGRGVSLVVVKKENMLGEKCCIENK